ncbi:MAG: MFS transporter [Dehalococcoidia bacterium]|nr:MFS transporter [Dehalococcoidia bacterium]
MTVNNDKNAISTNYKWLVYASVAVGAFLTVSDQTGTNIAMPRIAEDLSADIPTVQWVYLLYTLSISSLLLPMGRLSDLVGRKSIYCTGLAIFSVGALGAYLSGVLPILLGAKAVQGLGAAMIQANGMALMAESFPRNERGKALGLYMTIIGIGATGGPVIGGYLIGTFGWRSMYLAILMFGIMALVFSFKILKKEEFTSSQKDLSFDWIGAALSASALALFLLGLTYTYRLGWSNSLVIVGFLLSAVSLAGFIWWEKRNQNPIVDLSLFSVPEFSLGMAARYLAFMSGSSAFFLMPFYLIQVIGLKESEAALVLAPSSIMMAITSPLSGRLSDKIGTKWPAVAGLICWAAAVAVYTTITVDSSPWIVVTGMFLQGSGNGIFGSPNTTAVMNVVESNRYGVVSALVNMVRTSGNLTGIAIGTTLVVFTMASRNYPPDLSAIESVGATAYGEGLKAAFTEGITRAFWIGTGIVGFAALFTAFGPEKPIRQKKTTSTR